MTHTPYAYIDTSHASQKRGPGRQVGPQVQERHAAASPLKRSARFSVLFVCDHFVRNLRNSVSDGTFCLVFVCCLLLVCCQNLRGGAWPRCSDGATTPGRASLALCCCGSVTRLSCAFLRQACLAGKLKSRNYQQLHVCAGLAGRLGKMFCRLHRSNHARLSVKSFDSEY